MKRIGLLVILLAGCHRDLDLELCEHNPAYCADAAGDADESDATAEVESDAAAEVEGTDSASTETSVAEDTSTAADSEGSDASADSMAVADTAVADTTVADTTVADTAVADTAVADTTVADTKVADTAVADTSVVDSTVTDTAVADTGYDAGADTRDSAPVDTCVCAPGEVVSVTGTCSGALEKKTKTCLSSCTWGAEVCALPKGWTAISAPPTGFAGRMNAGATWTGGELFLLGGTPSMEGTAPFSDGALYQLYSNSWTLLPTAGAPSARTGHACVFTGLRVLCWGGRDLTTQFSDGVEYDPTLNKWSALPSGPLSARSSAAGVWATTTKQFLLWGGQSSTAKADGAAYDPATSTWTTLPTAPIAARVPGSATWTGTELLIWGGTAADGSRLNDGAFYNPSTKTWRTLPGAKLPAVPLASSGVASAQFFYFGGVDVTTSVIRWQGESLSLATLTWSDMPVPTATMLGPRIFPSGWAQGARWFLWSGYEDDGTGGVRFLANGAVYDLSAKTWASMTSTDAPTGRALATALPMSNGGIVWGGMGKPGGGVVQALRDGAIYVP